jgi:ABC-type dipeptide/oligopeptide/nickel transport system permease component
MTVVEAAVTARPRVPWFVSFLAMRVVWAIITLLIYLSVVFFFMQVWVPYSWATQFLAQGSEAYRHAMEMSGLDRPLPEQYVGMILGLARGDLGTSFSGVPVSDMIRNALPVTLAIFIVGTIIGWFAGEMLGRIGSWRRRGVTGSAISVAAVISTTIFPPFLVFLLVRWLRGPLLASRELLGLPRDSLDLWRDAAIGTPGAITPAGVALLVSLGFAAALVVGLVARSYGRRHHLPWVGVLAIPVALVGLGTAVWLTGLGQHALDLLYRIDPTVSTGRGTPALVILGLALIAFGPVMLLMRAGTDAERSEDYVFTARAKGLREAEVRDRHVARNAIAPVLAGSFLALPTILAGMIIVEYELEMDGLSSVLFDAIEFQDIPVIMGILVALGVIGVILRVVIDVAIAILDPRQRRARA